LPLGGFYGGNDGAVIDEKGGASGGRAFARLARRLGCELGLGPHFARAVLTSRYWEVGSVHVAPAAQALLEDDDDGDGDGDGEGCGTAAAAGAEAEAWAVDAAEALRGAIRSAEAADGHPDFPLDVNTHAEREEYFAGVASICAAHLLEATALRAFGAARVEAALAAAER
jgi:hypothetical protein